VINEVYGAQAARYMEAGGFRLVHDFQMEAPAAFAGVPPQQYPYLFMLRREWVEPAAVNPLSMLFSAPAPRIYFSAAQRRVLERALLNESDVHIAGALDISQDAVKPTWRHIYSRIGQRAPYVFPAGDSSPSGSRGQEKRRHVLDYLRAHLEELRPASAPSRSSRSASDFNPTRVSD
jgi:hypothetical protein